MPGLPPHLQEGPGALPGTVLGPFIAHMGKLRLGTHSRSHKSGPQTSPQLLGHTALLHAGLAQPGPVSQAGFGDTSLCVFQD